LTSQNENFIFDKLETKKKVIPKARTKSGTMVRVKEKILSKGIAGSIGEDEDNEVLSEGEFLSKTEVLCDYSL
jgi:hypothetical protein